MKQIKHVSPIHEHLWLGCALLIVSAIFVVSGTFTYLSSTSTISNFVPRDDNLSIGQLFLWLILLTFFAGGGFLVAHALMIRSRWQPSWAPAIAFGGGILIGLAVLFLSIVTKFLF